MRATDKLVPKIKIIYIAGKKDVACEAGYGIEEEGLFYELIQEHNDIWEKAYESACLSKLYVGIGISEKEVRIYHKKCGDEPVAIFKLEGPELLHGVRIIGTNAARLVIGKPFKNKSL